MRIGILGTGPVARTLGKHWVAAGHAVALGSREPAARGDELEIPATSLAAVVAENEVIVNATPGAVSLRVVEEIGADAFAGRLLVDVANANTPAFELVYPNSSLAEQLQAALPGARVVKTLNTAAMTVLTEPAALPPSSVFVSGDDADAKAAVADLLIDFGWSKDAIVDLGGIRSARGPEHYFLLFAAIMQSRGDAAFNIRLVS